MKPQTVEHSVFIRDTFFKARNDVKVVKHLSKRHAPQKKKFLDQLRSKTWRAVSVLDNVKIIVLVRKQTVRNYKTATNGTGN
jgi:hypothetical protein